MMRTDKRKVFRTGLPVVALILVVGVLATVSVNRAWAYFTTYATARGGYTFTGGPDIVEVVGARKDIQITTKEGTSPIYVRVNPMVAEEYVQYLSATPDADEGGSTWVQAGEYWYYTRALTGVDQTAYLHVALRDVPKKEEGAQSFNIIVAYEEIPAVAGEDYQTAWQHADETGGNN